MRYAINLWLWLALTVAIGCSTVKRQRGGKASAIPGGLATMEQPENPAQPARQASRNDFETVIAIPAGTRIVSRSILPAPDGAASLSPTTNTTEIILAAPTEMRQSAVRRTETEIGAAQKDIAGEIGARLSAVRPLQILGVIIALAGVAMFHPAIKAVTMSTTLQIGCFGVGAALVFLPLLMAGKENLILAAAGILCAGLAVWYLAHRHGQLKGFVDANQNGIDDRKETKL